MGIRGENALVSFSLRPPDGNTLFATLDNSSSHLSQSPALWKKAIEDMYAIIEDKGKQFKVTSGDTISLDRPGESEGGDKTITFDRVLMVGGEGAPKIGTPTVAGVTVSATIIRELKAKKVRTVRYHRRKGFHKTIGHRQKYLSVKITGINI